MKPILTLPCKNKHSDMERLDKGYHCKDCNRILTDFRNSTGEEINAAIQANPEKTCGIFNNDQFEHKVSSINVPAFRAVGLSLLGILGFLGPVLTSCESDPAATGHKQKAFNLLKFPMHIQGTVMDEKTGKPVPFFEVEVLQHNKRIKLVKTDKDGNFDILILQEDLDEEVFKLAIGGNTIEQRDTITAHLTKFRNKSVRLTIKAKNIPEMITPGFIAPKLVKRCDITDEMTVDEVWTTAGIPASEYLEVPEELPNEAVLSEVIVTAYEAPMIEKENNSGHKFREWRRNRKWEKAQKKNDRLEN